MRFFSLVTLCKHKFGCMLSPGIEKMIISRDWDRTLLNRGAVTKQNQPTHHENNEKIHKTVCQFSMDIHTITQTWHFAKNVKKWTINIWIPTPDSQKSNMRVHTHTHTHTHTQNSWVKIWHFWALWQVMGPHCFDNTESWHTATHPYHKNGWSIPRWKLLPANNSKIFLISKVLISEKYLLNRNVLCFTMVKHAEDMTSSYFSFFSKVYMNC